jgi:hypothetical protein
MTNLSMEERREEKEMDIDVLYKWGKRRRRRRRRRKGDGSVVKLGILGFLLGCFTDG